MAYKSAFLWKGIWKYTTRNKISISKIINISVIKPNLNLYLRVYTFSSISFYLRNFIIKAKRYDSFIFDYSLATASVSSENMLKRNLPVFSKEAAEAMPA